MRTSVRGKRRRARRNLITYLIVIGSAIVTCGTYELLTTGLRRWPKAFADWSPSADLALRGRMMLFAKNPAAVQEIEIVRASERFSPWALESLVGNDLTQSWRAIFFLAQRAATFTGHAAEPAALAALRGLAAHPSAFVRGTVAEALPFDAVNGAGIILPLLADSDAQVVSQAMKWMEAASSGRVLPAAPAVIDALVALLDYRAKNFPLIWESEPNEWLAVMGGDRGITLSTSSRGDVDQLEVYVRRRAWHALVDLGPARSPAIAEAVGRLQDADVCFYEAEEFTVPLLESFVGNRDVIVSEAAFSGLRRLALESIVPNAWMALHRLGRLGPLLEQERPNYSNICSLLRAAVGRTLFDEIAESLPPADRDAVCGKFHAVERHDLASAVAAPKVRNDESR